MASVFTELFGDKLLSKTGEVSTSEALSGKATVGIYFSAHWCPPCRGFTPVLAKNYTDHYKAKGMEIVFVSSDRDEQAFKDYYGEHPWLALPYDQRGLKAKLSKKFKVEGIPTFVVLDGATGETITTDGRENVDEDPTGKDLPWKPPSFWDALGDEFLKGVEGETVDVDELKTNAKIIGLYFSAHWCPPCRSFTPMLVEAYKKHLKDKGCEIIFVSSDRDQASFMEYYGTMPWLAIPQGDPRKNALSKRFGVQGIPTFALVDAKTGATICANARGKVMGDATCADFPYYPKPANNLSTDGPDGINDEASLCVLLDGCDEATQTAAIAAVTSVAEQRKAAGDEMLFFYGTKPGEIVGKVRELCKAGEPKATPQMLLLDIPDDGGYYVSPATEATADTINGFLEAYKAKGLERQQLG